MPILHAAPPHAVPPAPTPTESEPARRFDAPAAQPVWTGVAAALVAGGLAGCGGGSGSTTPAPAAPMSSADAGRFLTQATLGYNRADLNAMMATTYSDWIDAQFAAPTTQGHYAWLVAKGYNNVANINSQTGMDNTVWRKLIGSSDPLRQRMVLALSELFVVSILGVNTQWRQFCIANYLDILEANAFGNYRTLMGQITLSSAMGYYLTYRGNLKANPTTGSEPDENYARELMQLFTIGLVLLNPDGSVQTGADGLPVETYSQADVSGLARVFTGWNVDVSGLTAPYPPDYHQRAMVSNASQYESGSKSFLGTTVPAGTSASASLNQALDAIFHHPNLPTFVGKQLIQRLVTSNPTADYVARVSGAFVDNGAGVRGDLKAVIKAVLLDPQARDATLASSPTAGKLREPVVRFLNWARAFNATSPSGTWNVGDLSDPGSRLGQSPMRSGSVFNFFSPGYVPPNTTLSSQGLLAPEFQITDESSVAGYVNFMQRVIAGSGAGDLTPDYSSLLPMINNPAALLDELNQVLAAGQLSAATLSTLATALASIAVTTTAGQINLIHAAVTLVMASPEYLAQK